MERDATKRGRRAALCWGAGSVVVVCVLPWLTLLLDPGTGMGIFVLCLFVVAPIYFVFLGIFAGKGLRRRWVLPFLAPGLFLLEGGLIDAWHMLAGYAGAYLALGFISMMISWSIAPKGEQAD